MKIIPTRTMQLDGRDVIDGKVVDVSDAEAQRAINSGWAVAARAEAAADPADTATVAVRRKAPPAKPNQKA